MSCSNRRPASAGASLAPRIDSRVAIALFAKDRGVWMEVDA